MMMASAGLRLDGYVRVSKVGGRSGEGFISPDVQADAIRQWAGDRHVLTIHEPELDRSDGTMNRPIFNQVLDRIRSGDSDGIVVYKVDRFARSLLHALSTLQEIADAGGSFASVSDNVDLTTAQGRAFLQMQLVFAQLFRDQIREGFATATSRAVARGVHIANSVPPGFDRVDQRLVPNADAPAIRELFERRAAGQGASALARWLDTAIPRPNGEVWTPAHVSRLLTMRVFLGEAHYGEHRNTNAHEPIVTADLFDAAGRARAPAPPRSERTHLLAGIVRCAGCRYLMTPAKSGRNHDTLVYRCRERHTAGRCPAPASITRRLVEGYVVRQAQNVMAGGEVRGSAASAELESTLARLAVVTAARDEFAADIDARSILGDGPWRAALRARAEAVTDAELEAEALRGANVAGSIDLGEWEDFDTAERRQVLANLTDGVFVRRSGGLRVPVESRVWIAWRGTGPDDLPRRGRANGPVRAVDYPPDQAGMTAGQDASNSLQASDPSRRRA